MRARRAAWRPEFALVQHHLCVSRRRQRRIAARRSVSSWMCAAGFRAPSSGPISLRLIRALRSSSGQPSRDRHANVARRMGGLLSQIYPAAVAGWCGTQAPAGHARLPAHCLRPDSDSADRRGKITRLAQKASRFRRSGGSTTTLIVCRGVWLNSQLKKFAE